MFFMFQPSVGVEAPQVFALYIAYFTFHLHTKGLVVVLVVAESGTSCYKLLVTSIAIINLSFWFGWFGRFLFGRHDFGTLLFGTLLFGKLLFGRLLFGGLLFSRLLFGRLLFDFDYLEAVLVDRYNFL